MERKYNDLWVGGPWEQPSRPVVDPPRIPRPKRPALRVRKKRRSPLKIFLILLAILAAIAAAVVLAGLNGFFPIEEKDFGPYDPSEFPFPFPYHEYEFQEEADYSIPPDIDLAPTGSGVTLELQPGDGEELNYEQIYARCAPSIVSITASGRYGTSTGTGIVLTQDGYLLTNAHVVAGASSVGVVTFDNRAANAALVGFDADEDLAVLKVELDGLTPARFGSSDELRIGEEVAAIGDALGYRSTITDGIISALDREVTVDGVTMTLIQTSAAINFGNSGGALLDRQGRVVGITTVKLVADDGSTEAMGFAIPSNRVKYVADRLIAGEKIVPGALGITVNTLPVNGSGLEVLAVDEHSDAYAKGIRVGDVLLRANGQELTSTQVLTRLKITRGAGDILVLSIQRGEEVFDIEVALTATNSMEGYP